MSGKRWFSVVSAFLVVLSVSLALVLLVPRSVAAQPAADAAGAAKTADPADPAWSAWKNLSPQDRAKVDPRILAELRGEVVPAHLGGSAEQSLAAPSGKPLDKTRFMVHLTTHADLGAMEEQAYASQSDRRAAVMNALRTTAYATQGPVKAVLDAGMQRGDVAAYQPFHIVNGFAVEGGLATVVALAKRDDVARIVANYPLRPLWTSGAAAPTRAGLQADLDLLNWNIDLVDADRVWSELRITGSGAVVAGIDTGVDWTHPALRPRYRGLGAAGSDHDYNWFDPDPNLYPGGDLGPSRTAEPFDLEWHGTHTMGTMVGDGGTPGTQVGMAPGARWIAISLNQMTIAGGMADDIMANKAFQWMLCPTDLTGRLATADCSRAPDVVNNSWGSANPADDTFRPALQALRAAGIAPVFSAGNPEAGPGSIGTPGSIPEAITVGATDVYDTVAYFSGRGPSFYDGEQKPELSAPGVDVNSTLPGGGYSGPSWSGTSMAAPHVAGLIALMVSADLQDGVRDLNVDELERLMEYTAVDLGSPGPDDDYGFGRIDALAAVRWARSAGDLRGRVTDAVSAQPIQGATVTGLKTSPKDQFVTTTDAGGAYATTVPAGTYDIGVEAWGYLPGSFPAQTVLPGAQSVADFALTPQPRARLTGTVRSGAGPVAGVRVHVSTAPWVSAVSNASGGYSLSLPPGSHLLVAEADGYRIQRDEIEVPAGGAAHDFSLTTAPRILLVDADSHAGWFIGWPMRNYFRWALDQGDYRYDLWVVRYLDFNDTQPLPDGSTGVGVPSAATLAGYDLVIWAHGGGGSPTGMGADDELMAYLDQGGRLILSGQDLAYVGEGTALFDRYLHADPRQDSAALAGETVSGLEFLSGLTWEITNASLHGVPNGATYLSPDAVAAQDGAAYPLLAYDSGNGYAALAVDPCDAAYRAVYLALGYENIGPRAGSRDPAIAELLERSIDWLVSSRPAYNVSVVADPARQMAAPGSTAQLHLQLRNTGLQTDSFALGLVGNLWPSRLYTETAAVELSAPIVVPPCAERRLRLEVDVPVTAATGAEDQVTVTASGRSSASADVTTVAFPTWQFETSVPTPRYRLAAASLSGQPFYYALGGLGGETYDIAQDANERYSACSRQWERLAPLPTPRGNIGAAALAGKIYVPGGYNGFTALDVLEIYDPASDSWSSGAPLPKPLGGAAVAAHGGKLYLFGGLDVGDSFTDATFAYDPAADSWTEKAPMPGGARAYAAAAELGDKIYVVGGWMQNTVEVYDPATDSWSAAAPMNVARQAPGLAAAPDGSLYVSGGGYEWTGLDSAERYDPVSDRWTMVSALNSSARAGSASAYAAGRVFAVGGVAPLSDKNESLAVWGAFCLSDLDVQPATIVPGGRITYTVTLRPDAVTLPAASLVDPIPAGTDFSGFGANPIGAVYNAVERQVEWRGALPAGAAPRVLSFAVDVASAGWEAGDLISNTVAFDSGTGQAFERTVTTVLYFPDPSPSFKGVEQAVALAGDLLTYTVHVESDSRAPARFVMSDPIPAGTSHLRGPECTSGTCAYDPARRVINWQGMLPILAGPDEVGGGYGWGDSDGNGSVPAVKFEWADITGTGINAGVGDDMYYCDLPIGFPFEFYGSVETDFCVSTNGFVSFDRYGFSDLVNECPLPDPADFGALIAAIWDDLVVESGVYYQTFGVAPNRVLVVQWAGVHHYGDGTYFDFELILYERGSIEVQILSAGPETGAGSTTGIEDRSQTLGLTYACDTPGSLHDQLAVRFEPPVLGADVTFVVRTDALLPANGQITNTATIKGPVSTVERSAHTRVNPVDLSASTKAVDKEQAGFGDVLTYTLHIVPASPIAIAATLSDPLPPGLSYVPGSLEYTLGVGGYDEGSETITWQGDLPAALSYVNTGDAYEWGDSDGAGEVPGVAYEWVDIRRTGTRAGAGDNGYFCGLPLGFVFDFYETPQTTFCVSTNGFLSFDAAGTHDRTNDCPLPNTAGNSAVIGAVWDDLVTKYGIYYQTLGVAPDRSLVVQWNGAYTPDDLSRVFDFEVILHESGAIQVQLQQAPAATGAGSTTGIEGPGEKRGLTYACNTPGSLHDRLAVVFVPPGAEWEYQALSADVTFSASVTALLADGTPLTNTATLNDNYGGAYELAAAVLTRAAGLSGSFKQVDPAVVSPGATVTYTVYVRNAGGYPAQARMVDVLPPQLAYDPGSLVCGTGSCSYASGAVTWSGRLDPRAMVPVRFRAHVPEDTHDGTVITNTAVVSDTVLGLRFPVLAAVMVQEGAGRTRAYLPLVLRLE